MDSRRHVIDGKSRRQAELPCERVDANAARGIDDHVITHEQRFELSRFNEFKPAVGASR